MLKNIKKQYLKLKNNKGLVTKAIKGSIWVGGGDFAANGLRFVRNMILTRILVPEDFGIMAIILALNATFESLTQIGISDAIIQNPRSLDRSFLNRAWWISIGRGLILYGLIFTMAPWIATFYNQVEIKGLIRISLMCIIFKAALSPRAYIELKKMNYKKWVIINHGGTFLGISAAVCSAFMFQNVWALVIGFTTEGFARLILSYLLCPFRPGLLFDDELSQQLTKYIQGYFGLPIMTLIFNQADIFVIGKLCSSSDLGIYNMALTLAQMPAMIMAVLMSYVGMPAFAEIQTDTSKINKAIITITSIMVILGIPAMLFAMFFGKDLLTVIYGPIYGNVALPFAIVLLRSMIQIIGNPIVSLFNALGRPNLNRWFSTIRAITIMSLIYPAIKYFNLEGAAMAGLIAVFIGLIIQIIKLYSITKIDLKKYVSVFLRISSCSIFIPLIWIVIYHFTLNSFINIFAGIVGLIFSYSMYIVLFRASNTKLARIIS